MFGFKPPRLDDVLVDLLSRELNKKSKFAAFANICGANIPTVANFRAAWISQSLTEFLNI